jgi:hypothetical protein
MAMPRRLASDLMAEHQPSAAWSDVEDWIVERGKSSGVRESAPGELGADAPTSMILALCRDELKGALTEAILCSAIRDVIACVHIDTKKPEHSGKARKISVAQSTLVLNLDYQASSVFRDWLLVNSIVWLMPRKQLQHMFDAGSLRLVTRHSIYHRRVIVKPSFPFTGEGKHEDCICVLLADLHSYVFLYKCFKSTNSNLTREHEQVHLLQAAANNIENATSVRVANNDVSELHGSLFGHRPAESETQRSHGNTRFRKGNNTELKTPRGSTEEALRQSERE